MSKERNHGNGSEPFEHALRRAVRQPQSAPAGVCPEPEILAAYFERSLSSAESADWEKHFSLCTRCQQQLAALARSEPEVARPSAGWSWLQMPQLRWLAPALVAVASVALWVAIRPTPDELNRIAREQPKQVSEAPAAAPVAKPPEAPASTPESFASRVKPSEQAGAKKQLPAEEFRILADEKKRGDLKSADIATHSQPAKNEAVQSQVARAETEPAKEKGALGLETQQALARDAATRQAQDKITAPQAQQAPPPAAVTGGVVTAPVEREGRLRKLETAKADAISEQKAAAGLAMNAVAGPTPAIARIAAPDGSALWQIGPAGRISKSSDAGKTWQPQASGVQTDLTGGQAVSGTVCWVVGRKGTVLRTTDGLHWQKIAFPLEADLIRVEARDASHAIVTTADGQSFVTEDGGQSWQKR